MRKPNNTIHLLDAPPGAGKTYTIINAALELASQGKRVAIAQPTTQLIHQTLADLQRLAPTGIQIRAITHAQEAHGQTLSQVAAHVMRPCAQGEILLMSHAAAIHTLTIDAWSNASSWHLMFDEVPDVTQTITYKIPMNRHLLESNLLALQGTPSFHKVAGKARSKFEAMRKNTHGDQVWGMFTKLLDRVHSPHWDTYINIREWNQIAAGDKQTQHTFYTIMRPSLLSGFAQVLIAGANVQDRKLHQLWAAMPDVQFLEATHMRSQLRHQVCNPNNRTVQVMPLTSAKISRHLRHTQLSDSSSWMDTALTAAQQQLGHAPFLYAVNNADQRTAQTILGDMAQPLPVMAHGLNDYQGVDQALVLFSLNPDPVERKLMEELGMDYDAQRADRYLATVLQVCLRCSLRNPHSTKPVTLVVADQDAAEYLRRYVMNVTILDPLLQIEHLMPATAPKPKGRPAKYATDAERMSARRAATRERMAKARALKKNTPTNNRENTQHEYPTPATICTQRGDARDTAQAAEHTHTGCDIIQQRPASSHRDQRHREAAASAATSADGTQCSTWTPTQIPNLRPEAASAARTNRCQASC